VFSIPYADYLIDRSDKDLSVAHLSCAGPLSASFQNRGDSIVCRQDRDHEFRNEIHRIPGTPIDFRMAFFACRSPSLQKQSFLNADAHQAKLDGIQAVWPNHRVDALHLRTFE
jgi:hypothetical protein